MKSTRSMHRIAATTKHYYFRRSWAKMDRSLIRVLHWIFCSYADYNKGGEFVRHY